MSGIAGVMAFVHILLTQGIRPILVVLAFMVTVAILVALAFLVVKAAEVAGRASSLASVATGGVLTFGWSIVFSVWYAFANAFVVGARPIDVFIFTIIFTPLIGGLLWLVAEMSASHPSATVRALLGAAIGLVYLGCWTVTGWAMGWKNEPGQEWLDWFSNAVALGCPMWAASQAEGNDARDVALARHSHSA